MNEMYFDQPQLNPKLIELLHISTTQYNCQFSPLAAQPNTPLISQDSVRRDNGAIIHVEGRAAAVIIQHTSSPMVDEYTRPLSSPPSCRISLVLRHSLTYGEN